MTARPTSRRAVVGTLGTLAAAGAAGLLPACATAPARLERYARPLSRQPFVAPRISVDRIVRVIVGHRPYRPSGFVVRRDEMDGKHVIHNYGHGGGGITLSWGSAALAVREAMGLPVGEAAVIGAGIMGLTTARLLQDAGWQVTIYTREVARHTTSNVGAGQWAPTSVFEEGKATAAFEAQFKFAARISHHAFQNLSGAGYGIRFTENYYLGDEPRERSYYLRELPELFASVADLKPDEHPFPVPYVTRTVTMMVEPATFLRKVRDDFYLAGGTLKVRDFKNVPDVLSLRENAIFNCTGMGAGELFGDDELTPVKGQLVFMPPDPAVDYLTVGGGSDVTYMFPRRGEILLGGSWKRDDWTPHVEPDVTERIIEDNRAIFQNLA
ncbi:MAG: FAD-dependent oxidoreductase [Pseudomonadota bacterium]